VPGSEEEEGGSGGGRRQQKAVCARLAAARAAGYKRGRAVVPNLATQMASIADLAPEVAKAVDIPVGNATTPDELHPDLKLQLATMDPVLHGTFLTFLEILLPACFKP
jgi:hypothetical protein